jgi:hypothetical protein
MCQLFLKDRSKHGFKYHPIFLQLASFSQLVFVRVNSTMRSSRNSQRPIVMINDQPNFLPVLSARGGENAAYIGISELILDLHAEGKTASVGTRSLSGRELLIVTQKAAPAMSAGRRSRAESKLRAISNT